MFRDFYTFHRFRRFLHISTVSNYVVNLPCRVKKNDMIWWWYWNDMGMMWGRLWSAFLQALIGVASISGKHHHGMKNDFTWVGNLSCTGCAANIRSHKLTANVWSPCLTRDSDYGLVAGPMRAPLPWCAAYQDCCGFQRHIRVVWRLLLDCKTTIPHRHPSPSMAIPQGWFPGKRSKISAMATFSGLFIPERPPELRSILMPQSNSCYRHMTEITSFPATYRKSKKPQFPLMWGSPQSGMPSKADIAWDQPNRTSWHCSQGSQKTADLVWKCHDVSWPFDLCHWNKHQGSSRDLMHRDQLLTHPTLRSRRSDAIAGSRHEERRWI